MDDEKTIEAQRIKSVQTALILDDPDQALLEITTGKTVTYFFLSIPHLASLARRLGTDAALLAHADNSPKTVN